MREERHQHSHSLRDGFGAAGKVHDQGPAASYRHATGKGRVWRVAKTVGNERYTDSRHFALGDLERCFGCYVSCGQASAAGRQYDVAMIVVRPDAQARSDQILVISHDVPAYDFVAGFER